MMHARIALRRFVVIFLLLRVRSCACQKGIPAPFHKQWPFFFLEHASPCIFNNFVGSDSRDHPHGEKALFKASIAERFSAVHSKSRNLTNVKSLLIHPVFPVVK